jgi:predicted GNAT superfamily acetyltransferase
VTVLTRPVTPDDLPQLLAVNNAAVPAVNELDAEALAAIVQQAHLAVAVVDDGHPDAVLGFALTLVAGAEYASENYRWFSARSSDFLYVDRIAVDEGSRGRQLGQALYTAIFAEARALGAAEVLCEVNLEPPNPGSLRFHGRLGFEQIGTLATKGGSVVVALMAAPVA